MSIKEIIIASDQILLNLPKRKLVEALQILKGRYNELEEQNNVLKEENGRLKEEICKKKIQSINEGANKPSSKQAE